MDDIMANIYFKCLCEKVLALDEVGTGKTVKCPDCGQPIQIPNPELKLQCVCGKAMLAPKSMAGEKVQCVECNEYVEIPATPKTKLWAKRQFPPRISSMP